MRNPASDSDDSVHYSPDEGVMKGDWRHYSLSRHRGGDLTRAQRRAKGRLEYKRKTIMSGQSWLDKGAIALRVEHLAELEGKTDDNNKIGAWFSHPQDERGET
eukprot:2535411-Heterocapsa_arctica.AAC.1